MQTREDVILMKTLHLRRHHHYHQLAQLHHRLQQSVYPPHRHKQYYSYHDQFHHQWSQ